MDVLYRAPLFFLLAVPLAAQTLNFEGLPDSTLLTNQYSGATFSNAIVLTTGITLDEYECPARSGNNAASDNGGPITIAFSSPLVSFGGYFNYAVPVTIQAFDSANHPLVSATSAFSNNQASSGASGSQPNELLRVSSPTSIYKVVITGGSNGTSFTVDDMTLIGKCDVNRDGAINVSDTQAILSQALGTATATADLDGDGAVNVVDAQIAINAVLGFGCGAR